VSSWSKLLEAAEPGSHVVQLYGEDEQLLLRNVSDFAAEGLRRGEGVIIIATPDHADAIVGRLREEGSDTVGAIGHGRLRFLDAAATLARFLVDGQPDWNLFQDVIGAAVQSARASVGGGGVRAFGEMVGLLWNEGKEAEAVRLEEFWNRLIEVEKLSLYCAYAIDAFEGEMANPSLKRLISTHTHICAGPRTLFSSPVVPRSSPRNLVEN
jgi:DcmR-like sensory protein